jgi:hypothetical protein
MLRTGQLLAPLTRDFVAPLRQTGSLPSPGAALPGTLASPPDRTRIGWLTTACHSVMPSVSPSHQASELLDAQSHHCHLLESRRDFDQEVPSRSDVPATTPVREVKDGDFVEVVRSCPAGPRRSGRSESLMATEEL